MDNTVPNENINRAPVNSSSDFDLGEIVRTFLRYKYLFLALLVSSSIIVTTGHFLYPLYKVRATIAFHGSDNSFSQAAAAKLSGFTDNGDSPTKEVPDKYLQLLNSFGFYLEVAKQLKASDQFDVTYQKLILKKDRFALLYERIRSFILSKQESNLDPLAPEKIASILSGMTLIEKIDIGNSIGISVTSSNSSFTLLLANLTADVAVRFLTENDLKEVTDAEQYIRNEMDENEKKIKKIDEEIIEFKKHSNILSIATNEGEVENQTLNLRRELEQARIEYRQNEKLLDNLKKNLDSEHLQVLEQFKKNGFREPSSLTKYGPLKRPFKMEKENNFLQIRIDTLKKALNELVNSQNPHFEQEVYDLHKKMELEYSLFEELKKQLFQIEMQRIFIKNRVRPFDIARPNDVQRDLSLQRKLLLALVFSLVFGGALTYLHELLIPKIKNRNDLDQFGMIFLGSIGKIQNLPQVYRVPFKLKNNKQPPLVCRFDLDSRGALAFKHIRARMMYLANAADTPGQIVSIHSANTNEGKTFVTTNLAACIASMKKRVLLIDCDYRKDSISNILDTLNPIDIKDVLSDHSKFGMAVKKSVLPMLDILSMGKDTAMNIEVFTSKEFEDLLQNLKGFYNYIILDAPPLLEVPDSALIGKHSDMVIFVASTNVTTKDALTSAIDIMLSLKRRRIYSILNRVTDFKQILHILPERRANDRMLKITAGSTDKNA